MKSIYGFVIKPKGGRYNNTKKIGDVDLIVNTEIQNHKFISQQAKVLYTPTAFKTNIKPGDDMYRNMQGSDDLLGVDIG